MNVRLAILSALAASVPFAALAAAPPNAGIYAANVFIAETGGTGCIDVAGEQYAGAVTYGGLDATSLTIRLPLASYPYAAISKQVLTISAGAGTQSPSGSFTWTVEGLGISESGSFSANITFVDAHSFTVTITEGYGACVQTLNIALVHV